MRTTHRQLVISAAALLLAASAAPAVADDGSRHAGHARGTLLSADIVGSLTTDPSSSGSGRAEPTGRSAAASSR